MYFMFCYTYPVMQIIIHHWSYTSGEYSNCSYVSVCLSVCPSGPISITTGRNFLILGKMIGYNVGLMPCSLKMLILFGIPEAQTKMSFQKTLKYTQSQTHLQNIVPFSPMFAHYIRLVLAAHTGQKDLIVRVNRVSTMALL